MIVLFIGRMMKRYFSFGAGIAVGLVLLVLAFLFIENDPPYAKQHFSFSFEGQQIAGQITLPLGAINKPIDCVVLVHGDGAMDREAFGFYGPFYSYFAERKMCTLSWDKPGVDQSQGDWLAFDMPKRAQLVGAAVAALRAQKDFAVKNVGLLGFSQAGWVMPKLDPVAHNISFVIFVSPAVNWMRQSDYMTSLREALGQKTSDDLDYDQALNELLAAQAPFDAYLALTEKHQREAAFSEARWRFVSINAQADLTKDIKQLAATPILLLLARVAFFGRAAFVDDFWATMDEFLAAQN